MIILWITRNNLYKKKKEKMIMKTKVAFVGCGYIADIHLRSLKQIPDVEVVAFCNPNLDKAQKVAKDYNARAYASCQEMLDKEQIDAVYICIPPFAHDGQELLIAAKKIPMFIEKPIALSLEYATKVAEVIKQNKLITSVGYIFRYLDIVEKIQAIINKNQVAMVLCRYSGTMPGVYWWGEKNLGGGQIMEQSTHVFDLMRMLVGEANIVQAFGNHGVMTHRKEYDVEDSSSVNLKFENNVVGNISSNCLYPNGAVVEMDIICDSLRIEISLLNGKFKVIDNNGVIEEIGFGMDVAFLAENQAFIEAVRTKDTSKIKSSYCDSLKTHELTLAAMDSINNNGNIVKISK